ncbi:YitT family protein [Lactobacillus sp. DCY120]|uniref:YitT family protein n=1 Tax=Bombilactobacillus apium TaxID=2675299 RepID=A0A850R938_9LACO|nr:YitT family protein [Bombilactobacillus apium]NVY95916.1 YitT family protein [Bombilactobacillus apium]
MVIGSLLYAIAINYFLIPTKLGEGGVTGLTTIAFYTLRVPTYLTNFVLNTLLLIIGVKFLDKKTILLSLWAVLWLSIFLKLPVFLHYQTSQTIIPTICGGILTGVSMSLILNSHGSIAGSTILGKIFNKYWGIPIGYATLFFDLAVAIPSIFIIGFENTILTIFELYISAKITNIYLSKFGSKRVIQIISSHYKEISQALSNSLHQGLTLIEAHGFYSKKENPIIYLICTSHQMANIIPMINKIDTNALVVSDSIRSVRAAELYRIL